VSLTTVDFLTDEELEAKLLIERTAQGEYLLQFFRFSHLRDELKPISRDFALAAFGVVERLPRNPERTTALRKLLEAKDCAVRAKIFE
jgi:hypothetical protein